MSKQKGVILVLAILVSMVLLILGIAILQLTSHSYFRMQHSHAIVGAAHLAEGGIEQAIYELNFGNVETWQGDELIRTKTFSWPEGTVVVDAVDSVTQMPTILAEATVPFAGNFVSEKVRVVLEREKSPLYRFGLFANKRILLNSNIIVEGNVGTNGIDPESIILDSNVQIIGAAFSGEGSDPEQAIVVSENVVVNDGLKSLNDVVPMPTVVIPEVVSNSEGMMIDGAVEIDAFSSGQYPFLNISNHSILTITGDVTMVVDDFVMGVGATLSVADGASLKIYVINSLDAKNQCIFNNISKDATKLLLYGTDNLTSVEIACQSDFYGGLYFPRGKLEWTSGFECRGALYADELILHSNINAAYDIGLNNCDWLPSDQSTSKLIVKEWQRIK